MTVIAYRDGVLASDSQARSRQNIRMGTLPKIHDLGSHGLAAISGYAPLGFAMLAWLKRRLFDLDSTEAQPEASDDENEALLVHFAPDGRITLYEKGMSQPEATGPYQAYAYGAELAMAAMWCGKTAPEAVECAIALCTECGGEVQVLRMDARE